MHGRVDWVVTSWKLRTYKYDKTPTTKLHNLSSAVRVEFTGGLSCHAYAAASWHLLSPVITQEANVLRNTFLLTMYIELGQCFQKNTHARIVATLFKDTEKFNNCFSMYHGVSAACMFISNIHTLLYLSCTDKISEQRKWFRVCHNKVGRFWLRCYEYINCLLFSLFIHFIGSYPWKSTLEVPCIQRRLLRSCLKLDRFSQCKRYHFSHAQAVCTARVLLMHIGMHRKFIGTIFHSSLNVGSLQ